MKIKYLFEKKVDGHYIPNAMPKDVENEYIDSILNRNEKDYNLKYQNKYNFTFPYSSEFYFKTFDNYILTSEIGNDINKSFLGGSNKITYFYYIGTGGNISAGMNISLNKNHTSYFENLSEKVIENLKTKSNFYLFINQQQEKVIFEDCEKIYKDCLKLKIPLNKIILSSDIVNFDIIVGKIEKLYNIKYDIKYFSFPWSLYQAAEMLDYLIENKNIVTEIIPKKPKKILCLNRNLRYNKILTLSYLLSKNYENECLISFDTNFLDKNKYDFNGTAIKNKNELSIGFKKILDIKELKLDITDFNDNLNLLRDPKYLYENSYLSLVNETEIQSNSCRITEKTFKPIINYHPFIIWGAPGTLELLKYYNFKTFSDYFDESYDLDYPLEFRLEKVYSIIDFFMKMNNTDFDNFIENIKDILIYNRKLLFEYKFKNLFEEYHINLLKILDDTFVNKYYSIIEPKQI